EGLGELQACREAFLVERALYAFVGAGDPAAAAEKGHGLTGLDLVAVVAFALGDFAALGVGGDVDLAEDLLEGLDAFGAEALALPLVPVLAFEQVVRVGEAELVGALEGLEFAGVIAEDLAALVGVAGERGVGVADEHKALEHG